MCCNPSFIFTSAHIGAPILALSSCEWVTASITESDRGEWTYLCRPGSTRPQECRSSHSPALRTLPWSRRRCLPDTDTASRGPCGTPHPRRTPSHCGHTWARLRKEEEEQGKEESDKCVRIEMSNMCFQHCEN